MYDRGEPRGEDSTDERHAGPLPQFLQPQQQQGQPSPQRPPRPMLSPEVSLDAQGFKPPYAKGNNEVKIIDDSAPSSPSLGYDDHPTELQPRSWLSVVSQIRPCVFIIHHIFTLFVKIDCMLSEAEDEVCLIDFR